MDTLPSDFSSDSEVLTLAMLETVSKEIPAVPSDSLEDEFSQRKTIPDTPTTLGNISSLLDDEEFPGFDSLDDISTATSTSETESEATSNLTDTTPALTSNTETETTPNVTDDEDDAIAALERQLAELKRLKAQRAAEEKAQKEAEEKRAAEEKAQKEAEEKRIAEEKAQKEAEEKRAAEEKAQKEAEEKRIAEEKAQKEAEEKRIAEEKAQKEAEEKRAAEEKAQKETEEKRAAEEKVESNPPGGTEKKGKKGKKKKKAKAEEGMTAQEPSSSVPPNADTPEAKKENQNTPSVELDRQLEQAAIEKQKRAAEKAKLENDGDLIEVTQEKHTHSPESTSTVDKKISSSSESFKDFDDDDDFDETSENSFFGGHMSQQFEVDPEIMKARKKGNTTTIILAIVLAICFIAAIALIVWVI